MQRIGASSRYQNVYGVGTKLYGRSEKQSNGSYLATKWLILFLLPIWPVATFRIYPTTQAQAFGYGPGVSMRHKYRKVPLNFHQVAVTYLVTYGIISAIAVLSFALNNNS